MAKNKKQEVKAKPAKEVKTSLKEQIKVMEQKKRAEVAPAKERPKLVDFDSWFHMRKSKIPAHHLKEIIWSYFASRGLSTKETIETYDNELKRYGI